MFEKPDPDIALGRSLLRWSRRESLTIIFIYFLLLLLLLFFLIRFAILAVAAFSVFIFVLGFWLCC